MKKSSLDITSGRLDTGNIVIKFMVLYLSGHSILQLNKSFKRFFWSFAWMLALMLDFTPH